LAKQRKVSRPPRRQSGTGTQRSALLLDQKNEIRKQASSRPSPHCYDPIVKILIRFFASLHALIAVLFVCASLVLIAIAAKAGWFALDSGLLDAAAAQGIIEAIGLIAIAVVALQIAQTIVEEEVIREAQVSAPTRVRRYLSRFMVVIVVALAVEGLVATFKALHDDLDQLPYAATLLISVAVLLAGWGVFIRLNRAAEELEPEAMEEAKSEDKKLG